MLDEKELESAVEGILFASGEPIHIERICFALSIERGDAERVLRRLQDYYAFERRGMRLLQMEDRWQLCSSPDHADAIRKAFEIRKPAKLSQPALEALTIIAYYQPTTRAYVDKLRGVDSAYTVGLLLERGLIETCGNLQAPGRPLLYRTTEKFLRSFHISSLDELPPLNEDDIPPQQLKIEDMQTVTPDNTPPSVALRRHLPPEGGDKDAPESVAEPDTVPDALETTETVTGLVSPPPATGEGGAATGGANAPGEGENVPPSVALRRHLFPEGGDKNEPETVAEPETADTPEAVPEQEITYPPRELLTVSYPRLLAPRPEPVRRRAARTPYRMAGTFRTRRKRPGRKRRKSRKIARPRRDTSPDTSSGTASPEASHDTPRRKVSSKTVRRCLHCLLCGCWLSWPFCSL